MKTSPDFHDFCLEQGKKFKVQTFKSSRFHGNKTKFIYLAIGYYIVDLTLESLLPKTFVLKSFFNC